MPAALHALIYPAQPGVIAERRMLDLATVPAHKQAWWRPIVVVGDDPFDPLTQKKTGPVTTIEASRVVDTYTVSALTAQEISDRKDAAVAGMNGSDYKPLLQILLTVVNDNRALRAKVNALIDATGQAATVTKFPVNQSANGTVAIDVTQLKAAIKALL